jgi:hypothetical protein
MITLAKLKTYRESRGDSDLWSRVSKTHDPAEITSSEWSAVIQILQRLHIVFTGMATAEFAEETFVNRRSIAEDEVVRDQLNERVMLPGMK